MSGFRMTGGCQCGAVRYALLTEPANPHICHCRMCQKAFGAFFAAFTDVPLGKFEVTRGSIATFRSSDMAERGFCRDCGTPLSIRTLGEERIYVAIGSLDEPAKVAPKRQAGIEGRMPWFDTITHLPGDKTTEEKNSALTAKIAASNHQHPDHDTSTWPMKKAG